MLAIRINPNNYNWRQYEIRLIYEDEKLNVFKRNSELIKTEDRPTDERIEELGICPFTSGLGFRQFSLDAINNSPFCTNYKVGFLYGLKPKYNGEDAILFTKESNDIFLVGVVQNIQHISPVTHLRNDDKFLSEWKNFTKGEFVDSKGQSFFENYQRNFLSAKSKFAFNLTYQNLMFFEKVERIKLYELPDLNLIELNKKWISRIDKEHLKDILKLYT